MKAGTIAKMLIITNATHYIWEENVSVYQSIMDYERVLKITYGALFSNTVFHTISLIPIDKKKPKNICDRTSKTENTPKTKSKAHSTVHKLMSSSHNYFGQCCKKGGVKFLFEDCRG